MTDSQKLDIILSKIEKIDSIENEIKEVKTTLENEIKEVKTTLENEIKEVKTTLENEIKEVKTMLESEIEEVRADVRNVTMLLENEIRPNIQRVAEGHLDLSRNLHEVIRYKDEIEMLSITTRMLESEVHELKSKVS